MKSDRWEAEGTTDVSLPLFVQRLSDPFLSCFFGFFGGVVGFVFFGGLFFCFWFVVFFGFVFFWGFFVFCFVFLVFFFFFFLFWFWVCFFWLGECPDTC